MRRGLTTAILATALIMLQVLPMAPSPQTSASPALAESPASDGREAPITKETARQLLSGLPALFVENQGQTDTAVSFYVQASDKTLYFTEDGVTIALSETTPQPTEADEGTFESGANRVSQIATSSTTQRWTLKLDFVGASRVRPVGLERDETIVSYFTGSPDQWHAGLPTYSTIVYPNLWPGIDLVFRGEEGALKYEFQVDAGADPSLIQLRYRGTVGVRIDDAGQLEIATPLGTLSDDKPVAWQKNGGKRAAVDASYTLGTLAGQSVVLFRVGAYDPALPLTIDPTVLVHYAGFIGGTGQDYATAIALDSSGNAYVAGFTYSAQPGFPVAIGPDLTYNGSADAFVAKVKADGSGLIYCGYIGGNAPENAYAIAVDAFGNAYVAGDTLSSEATFPVVVGPDLSYNGAGYRDAFVAKVNAAGTALVYCGYIGGALHDTAMGIAVDGSGNAYVTGGTSSTQAGFPVVTGPDLTYNDGRDAFVAKVTADGTALVYCGYIGGVEHDTGMAVAVDASGNAYVAGYTGSTQTTFPVAVGPDLTFNLGNDAFVAKVKADGTGLVYCGYIGGSGSDIGWSIALDASGNVYIAGESESKESDFPVAIGPDLTHNGGDYNADAFVAKVKADGTALIYCGYIGGSAQDSARSIAVDASGNAYIAGEADSTEATFPVAVGPDLTYNGSHDGFVAKVKADGTGLEYCGYVGGSSLDVVWAAAVDGQGDAYLVGHTYSTQPTFPAVAGPDLTQNGNCDGFIVKIGSGMATYIPSVMRAVSSW